MKLSKIIEPLFIIFLCLILVTSWFRKGLLFAGGEESLMFYDLNKTYTLFNSIWYGTDTGYQSLVNIARVPYFWFLSIASNFGFSNIQLQAFTFFMLLIVGSLCIYFLIKVTVLTDIELEGKKWIPILGAIFYIFNPFSMSQIWGRGLTFQFFSFALIPVFLLFFVLGLIRKNLIFGLLAVLMSFFLSPAFAHPAIVLTVWAAPIIYFLFYLNRIKNRKTELFFTLSYFLMVVVAWFLVHAFWIYPTMNIGNQLLENSIRNDGVAVLQGVSMHTPLQVVIRLVHNGAYYIDQIYGSIYASLLFIVISWVIPLISLFSIKKFKKCKDYKFYIFLFLISVFISIGSNFPTGWLLSWLFKTFPILQVLRNPYEKFGINLLLAYIPFFAVGTLVLVQKVSNILKIQIILPLVGSIIFFICVVFVWPMWNGSFAGGLFFNPWVKVPDYYQDADRWLKDQKGDFKILQTPLIPGDGIRYTWENKFQGIEPSEYIFSKVSVGKDNYFNRNHYAVLLDRFGKTNVGAYLPGRAVDNLDFKDDSLAKELSKLDVKYIILHRDVDWQFNGSVSPKQTEEYLQKQLGILKYKSFGQLDIYKVDIPHSIDLIYSPDINVTYNKVNNTNYRVEIKGAKEPFLIYFLMQFDNLWEAYIDNEKAGDHLKVYSYANAWRINKRGDYTINIKYKPQKALEAGLSVTKFSLISLIAIIVILFILRKNRETFPG